MFDGQNLTLQPNASAHKVAPSFKIDKAIRPVKRESNAFPNPHRPSGGVAGESPTLFTGRLPGEAHPTVRSDSWPITGNPCVRENKHPNTI